MSAMMFNCISFISKEKLVFGWQSEELFIQILSLHSSLFISLLLDILISTAGLELSEESDLLCEHSAQP